MDKKEQVEASVKEFYDQDGWIIDQDGMAKDRKYFADNRGMRKEYNLSRASKIEDLFRTGGNMFLDVGCGNFSHAAGLCLHHYSSVICMDISRRALDICRDKLGDKGIYILSSILEPGLEENISDGTLCEHMLFHVEKTFQEMAVRQLIRLTKPGKPIAIIYSNPFSPLGFVERMFRASGLNKLHGRGKLYYYVHGLKWWERFKESCNIEIRPHAVISARHSKILIPNNSIGKGFFRWCQRVEENHPTIAKHLWVYPLIVLKKKNISYALGS